MGLMQTAGWFLVFLVLFTSASLIRAAGTQEEVWENPYIDVMQNMWSYQYITELNKVGVVPTSKNFEPKQAENRGNLILYLYNMDCNVFTEKRELREKEREKQGIEPPALTFTDIQPETPLYDAIAWGYEYQLISGKSDNTFAPEELLNREQVCAIIARFAALEEISLVQVVQPTQFVDSLYIHPYARSGVTACQMAAVVKGYTNGYFYPEEQISRQECAAVVYRMMMAAQSEPPEGAELVNLAPGAYDSLYDSYVDLPFEPLIPVSEENAPLEFFNDTVFIGDSVSVMLESYCASSRALGGAKFLCTTSSSATGMLSGQLLPEWPKGSGKHPAIQESVKETGAKVVYIMLGMNNMAKYVDGAVHDLETLCETIERAIPDITIIVESVTPMTEDSPRMDDYLNNKVINNYNEKLLEICREHEWYYLNVAEVFKDESGNLNPAYCSDPDKMGMHFTYQGTKIWTEYIRSHVPEALLEGPGVSEGEAEA